jgi:carboxyl-terminal processing protease
MAFAGLLLSGLSVAQNPPHHRGFDDEEREICKGVMSMLPDNALSLTPMQSDVQRLVIRRYLAALDPRKMYFDQPDVDHFLAKAAGLDEKLRSGDMQLAYEIYELYRRRVHERVPPALEFLKQPQDFMSDESLDVDVRSWNYCASVVESSQRWQQWTKYELLWTRLPGESIAQRAKRIEQRYKRLMRDVDETDDDDLLEMFLNCVVKSYNPNAEYLSEKTLDMFTS